MMKHFILLFALCFTSLIYAQDKYITKTGEVTFEASVPSFEEVKATSKSTTAILNTKDGNFAALILVKGFRFKNALMEEHFNENYAESDEFPKATFKGNIANFNLDAISTTSNLKYNGELTFHGKTKSLSELPINAIKNEDGTIKLSGSFSVSVADFDIEIPKVVSNKLSKTVEVNFTFLLKKK